MTSSSRSNTTTEVGRRMAGGTSGLGRRQLDGRGLGVPRIASGRNLGHPLSICSSTISLRYIIIAARGSSNLRAAVGKRLVAPGGSSGLGRRRLDGLTPRAAMTTLVKSTRLSFDWPHAPDSVFVASQYHAFVHVVLLAPSAGG